MYKRQFPGKPDASENGNDDDEFDESLHDYIIPVSYTHLFADPAHGLSFGYAMNRMDLNVLPGVKTRNLISAVMKEVAGECS